MPNQPEMKTNRLTLMMQAISKKTLKKLGIGCALKSAALGEPVARKSTCNISTINMATILSTSMLEFLVFIFCISLFVLFFDAKLNKLFRNGKNKAESNVAIAACLAGKPGLIAGVSMSDVGFPMYYVGMPEYYVGNPK